MAGKVLIRDETDAERRKRIDIAVVYRWDTANYRQRAAIRAQLISNPTSPLLLDSKLFCKERPNKPL